MKAIIIDDEQSSIDILKMLIEKSVPEIKEIYTANGALEALNIVENQQFDIVFLDIEMPEINGFDFLTMVKNRNFEIIFTTAHNQYAIKAIKFSALDYLLKPIEISELKEAISRVLANRNTQKNYEAIHENLLKNLNNNIINEYRLAINTYDGVRFFDINNIEYLKADSNYTHLYTVDNKHIMTARTLKDFEETLEGNFFFRCHKSYIINLNKIDKIENNKLILNSGSSIEIARRRKDKLHEILKI